MKEYEGKEVMMSIEVNERTLFFSAKIIKVSKDNIKFIDKYNKEYTFRRKNIIEICMS